MAAWFSLRRYCKLQLAGESQYLNVPGASEVNIKLDDIFVPLTLERIGIEETYDEKTVLTAGNRIRIIGDPGSGKTSIAKKLLRDECKKALRLRRRARFPVLLELKRIKAPANKNKLSGNWLFDYMLKEVKKNEVYEIEQCFHAYASTAGLLVILDGLDEVASSSYPLVEQALIELSKRLAQLSENNTIVLLMRTQYHYQIRQLTRRRSQPFSH